jgi:hypothetical protein
MTEDPARFKLATDFKGKSNLPHHCHFFVSETHLKLAQRFGVSFLMSRRLDSFEIAANRSVSVERTPTN